MKDNIIDIISPGTHITLITITGLIRLNDPKLTPHKIYCADILHQNKIDMHDPVRHVGLSTGKQKYVLYIL